MSPTAREINQRTLSDIAVEISRLENVRTEAQLVIDQLEAVRDEIHKNMESVPAAQPGALIA